MKEKGWFKAPDEEKLQPDIVKVIEIHADELKVKEGAIKEKVPQFIDTVRFYMDRIDDKIQNPVSHSLEKIEGSMSQLTKDMVDTLAQINSGFEAYAMMHPSFNLEVSRFNQISTRLITSMNNIRNVDSNTYLEDWESAKDEIIEYFDDIKRILSNPPKDFPSLSEN